MTPSLGKFWHDKKFIFFLLLFAQGKLLTDKERTMRGMSNYPFCECCGLSVESTTHVVRDCRLAHVIWKSVVSRFNWNVFFNLSLVKWIIWNIRNAGKLNFQSGEWGSFYSIAC